MTTVRNLLAMIVVAGIGTATAQAQQNLPRPVVLYRSPSHIQSSNNQPSNNQPSNIQAGRFPAALTVRTVTSVGTPASSGTSTNSVRPITIGPAQTGPTSATGNQAIQPGPSNRGNPGASTQSPHEQSPEDQRQENGEKTPQQEWEEQQKRPTNQMLQNPSGAQNLTHAGFSNSQQYAPNNYLGPQFQNWSNQRNVGQMPGSFGEMSRFQPTAFGGYVAPNTYVGSGFSSWSNLSQGTASPGANGSWNFSVWP